MRLLAVCLLAMVSIAPKPQPAVAFIQPRVPLVLSGPYGEEIPLQVRIEPHADNRSYMLTWCGTGASGHTLDGADDAAIQPTVKALTIRVFPGDCELTATVYGPGVGQVRARATLTVHVCGGDDEGCIK